MKRILSGALAVIMLLSCVAFSSSAQSAITPRDEWDKYWAANKDDDQKVVLTPGEDESMMNFAWQSPKAWKSPCVYIDTEPEMVDPECFNGKYTHSHIDGYVSNRVTVTGLEENTTYYYCYATPNGVSATESFTTGEADNFKILFVSDIQCGGTEEELAEQAYNWQTLLDTAMSKNNGIDFVVSAGDNTNNDYPEQWIATLSPTWLRRLPFATVVGNHDKKGTNFHTMLNNPNTFPGLTPSTTGNDYWFRYGDVLFFCYNTNKLNVADHYVMTDAAIRANPDAKWRVAVMHHDVYGTASHTAKSDSFILRCATSALYDRFDFDLVLTGHDHVYGRSYFMLNDEPVAVDGYENGNVTEPDGTLYLTASAAAGKNRVPETPYEYFWLAYTHIDETASYSTIEFSDTSLSLKTFMADDNEQIDSFTINKEDEFENRNGGWLFGYVFNIFQRFFFRIDSFDKLIGLFE